MPGTVEQRLISVDETAAALKCAPGTVYGLVGKGLLRCVRIGRAMRFDPRALDDFIAAGGTPVDLESAS